MVHRGAHIGPTTSLVTHLNTKQTLCAKFLQFASFPLPRPCWKPPTLYSPTQGPGGPLPQELRALHSRLSWERGLAGGNNTRYKGTLKQNLFPNTKQHSPWHFSNNHRAWHFSNERHELFSTRNNEKASSGWGLLWEYPSQHITGSLRAAGNSALSSNLHSCIKNKWLLGCSDELISCSLTCWLSHCWLRALPFPPEGITHRPAVPVAVPTRQIPRILVRSEVQATRWDLLLEKTTTRLAEFRTLF